MSTYLVQIDGTDPKNWRFVSAPTREDAIVKAVKPIIEAGHNPERAYVALGTSCWPNGAPFCVQSYRLTVNRDKQEAAA